MHKIDDELLEACAEQSRLAQKKLYEICFHMLMPVCYRYHNNEEDARAQLNLGFLKICNNIEKYSRKVPFEAWAKRIMINTLIDEFRKSKRYKEHIQTRETERELDYYSSASQNGVWDAFEEENVLELLTVLPEISKRVFNLYIIEGYTHKEIGSLLGMSDGTSKWHLSNARKILKETLEKIRTNEESKRIAI